MIIYKYNNINFPGDVTSLAIDALTKEMNFEAFAEKEELERERREWQELKDLANSDISSGPEYYGAMGLRI